MPVSVGDVRTRAAAVIGTALVLALSGCTTPEPAAPTPTAAFASEEEAFAAAEETYRAYVDALNQVDLSDPETFEDVYAWTTGEAKADFRKSFSGMHADGLTVSGDSTVTVVETLEFDPADPNSIKLATCLDVSEVKVVDPAGQSVVDPQRTPIQSLTVVMTADSGAEYGWKMSEVLGREGEPKCG